MSEPMTPASNRHPHGPWSVRGRILACLLLLGAAPGRAAIAPQHDLGPAAVHGTPAAIATGANEGIVAGDDAACVFCHTPALQGPFDAATPQWNNSVLSGTNFTPYGDRTTALGGEILPVGAVSLPCLSCHDGAQAPDNVINVPESGTTSGASNIPVTHADTSWSPVTTATGRARQPTAWLPGDLSGHHPIGVKYCGGGPSTSTPTQPCFNPDFKGGPGHTGLQIARVNERLKFWVDSGAHDGIRQKSDLPLYTRMFRDGEGPSVECPTCHDPHGSANPTFLRVPNTGSRVCLTCHVK